MKVQAEVSLYPLRTPTLMESIQRFVEAVGRGNVEIEMGPMSTRLSGECKELFDVLGAAFENVAESGDVVLTVKVSNASPSCL